MPSRRLTPPEEALPQDVGRRGRAIQCLERVGAPSIVQDARNVGAIQSRLRHDENGLSASGSLGHLLPLLTCGGARPAQDCRQGTG